MRKLIAVAAAAGLAVLAVPAATSAAPVYGPAASTAVPGIELAQEAAVVVVRRGHRRHCWWRHGRKICRW